MKLKFVKTNSAFKKCEGFLRVEREIEVDKNKKTKKFLPI